MGGWHPLLLVYTGFPPHKVCAVVPESPVLVCTGCPLTEVSVVGAEPPALVCTGLYRRAPQSAALASPSRLYGCSGGTGSRSGRRARLHGSPAAVTPLWRSH